MGHHIGILIWNARAMQPQEMTRLLFPQATLLQEYEDRPTAFELPDRIGAVATLPNHTIIAHRLTAMSLVMEAEFPIQSPTQTALDQLSMIGDVALIYQHSTSETCGHVLISKGRQAAFHIGYSKQDTQETQPLLLPNWYLLAPKTYQEDYAFAMAEAMLGASFAILMGKDLRWQLFELT